MLYFAILVCIGSDIGGFVFGKIIKGKKLTRISPNKTFSGVFGAYIFSFLFLFIFNTYFLKTVHRSINVSLIYGINEILVTIIFSTLAQLGDLSISYLKRIDKIKDTGKIFPGHGGLFDRIDSLMFVIIVSYIFIYLLKSNNEKKIAILGSTGSIGKSSLDTILIKKKLFSIEILAANKNFRKISEQIKKFKPKYFIITDYKIYKKVKKSFKNIMLKF